MTREHLKNNICEECISCEDGVCRSQCKTLDKIDRLSDKRYEKLLKRYEEVSSIGTHYNIWGIAKSLSGMEV